MASGVGGQLWAGANAPIRRTALLAVISVSVLAGTLPDQLLEEGGGELETEAPWRLNLLQGPSALMPVTISRSGRCP
jgi:hypothetical protein